MVADIRESFFSVYYLLGSTGRVAVIEGRGYIWELCFPYLDFRGSNGDGDVVVIMVENVENVRIKM